MITAQFRFATGFAGLQRSIATDCRRSGLSSDFDHSRQLENILRDFNLTSPKGATEDLILAALLHDIGQIVPIDSAREMHLRMQTNNNHESVGRIGHETLGAVYLRGLGFSESVCRSVESLVPAKRAYYDSLSAASKKSLEFQGGPFNGVELAAFEADPLREEMVMLRLWDDRAKVPGIEDFTLRAGEYLGMIVGHLEGRL
ncbi:uncharacterized protein L432 [Aspergillus lentulus]|uniref:Uncharacterized protein L432 n=1 Tax=Aspergillus lentulus TaxID=293939 RepID=A0AAN4PDG6_ASPLE|nr:uncharacterized protein L432 [Aspergillus lentulus]